jgi:hypothetical protein
MARSKSNPGSKTNRASENQQQNIASEAVTVPDVKAVAETAPAKSPEATRTAVITPEAEAKVKPEAKVASDRRKFEVMKADSRKNVLPINLDDEIRRRAYELYQQRGSRAGSEADDWLNAEREVRQRYRQQSA